MKKTQRGLTLITALAIVAIFLAVSLLMLDLATHNGQNVGSGYTKQQYFDVAEAGIDRGLADIDSTLPAPGSNYNTAAPPTPPPTPSGDQTALPSIPGVIYHYSYWHNPSSAAASTPDPLNAQGFGAASTITVPGNGTLIWSYTKNTGRDVGIETIDTVLQTVYNSCALCAGGNISVSGTACNGNGCQTPPPNCIQNGQHLKICTDPSPLPTPTAVPITTGGSYTTSGNCNGMTCAFGDGSSTPNPYISQNASTSAFLDSQATIDALGNAQMWSALSNSNTSSTVHYNPCTSGCTNADLTSWLPSAGSTDFFNGNLLLSSGANGSTIQYGGLIIVNGCLGISGSTTLQGNGQTAEVIVLGTDAQSSGCGGSAFSISGNALWNMGTLYTANGSVSISGTGKVKWANFYGDLISAGTVSISGNGGFVYQAGLSSQSLIVGQYAVDSFIEY